nr:PREDICTED: UPF0585 protein C16orf13 homolog A-like [Bemisia tabaci]
MILSHKFSECCATYEFCSVHRAFGKFFPMATVNITQHYPGVADRNKEPILGVLKKFLTQDSEGNKQCLEVSSGCGFHVSYFSKHFPFVTFQPTEFETYQLPIISSCIADCPNVLPPKYLDASQDHSTWADGTIKPGSFDYVININMMHISPYPATIGLFKGCGAVLKPGGLLITYGPYADNGILTPESNVRFNAMLKRESPDWGIRDISLQLIPLASTHGLQLIHKEDLPANNKCLVWKKS